MIDAGFPRSLALLASEDRKGERKQHGEEIPIGARGEAQETVEFKHTLTAHHPELPPVYSTPDMIRLMETAAFLALQPYCEGDEITVGTSINIQHRAASGIGARIQAEAVLESFDGRFYVPASGGARRGPGNWPWHCGPRRRKHWEALLRR
jgi:predicted thioesterase